MLADQTQLLTRLLTILPYIAIWIAGIALCMQFRKNNQRETTLFILAFAFMIAHILFANLMQYWLMLRIEETSYSNLSYLFSILQFSAIGVHLICWALILTGIYQLLQSRQAPH